MEREKSAFDNGWKFHYGDIVSDRNQWGWAKSGSWMQGPESRNFDDSEWEDVTLPHDYVIGTEPVHEQKRDFDTDAAIPAMETTGNMHTTAGSFQRRVSWYRKHFTLPETDRGKELYLILEGIYRNSTVYLNDFLVGHTASGFDRAVCRITDFALYGEENCLSVKVDPRDFEGWFYTGGGIYRHAFLLKTAPCHMTSVHVISHLTAGGRDADVEIRAELTGQDSLPHQEAANLSAKTVIRDAAGEVVAETDETELPQGSDEIVMQTILPAVKCWDADAPVLYQAEVKLYEDRVCIDREQARFGVREIRFDPDQGFFLNGRNLKLRGVCCHQNHGGLGSAIPDEIYRYRIRKLKELGVNAYRCSHYPPSPSLLDICDEEGMLVMDEARLFSSSEADLRSLETMVRRDRNHPSVILYSIGNEEAQSQMYPQAAPIAHRMVQAVHRLDADRPVTMAMLLWDLRYRRDIDDLSIFDGLAEELDVIGCNYHSDRWEEFHRMHPDKPFVCTEQVTFKSTRGVAFTDAEHCRLAITDESVDFHMAGAEEWHVCRQPWVSGLFLWTGFDYYGEPTPYGWPAVSSQFGLMDLCGNPKDFYYYYKAWWRDEPLLHIFPHWNLHSGDRVRLHAFGNCEEAELLVNGESMGRQRMEQDGYLVWPEVTFAPGEVVAVGYRDGREICRDRVVTTGEACRLSASVEYEENKIAVIRIAAEDADGNVVPDADIDMSFTVENGAVLGSSNGNPLDHDGTGKKGRSTFNGLAQLIVRKGKSTGSDAAPAQLIVRRDERCSVRITPSDSRIPETVLEL